MYHRFNVLEGTIRSGKDYTSAVSFVERIKNSEDYLFMVGGVSIDRAFAIVGQIILDYCGEYAVKTKFNETTAIRFDYGGKSKYIIFVGGYHKNSQDTIQGLSLELIYLTEANLLNEDFISQCLNRMASYKNPALYITINPKGPKDSFYVNFLDIWMREGKTIPNWINYTHTNLFDNPIMTPEKIAAVTAGRDPTSVGYKRDILGLRVDPEGSLFYVDDKNIIDVEDTSRYLRYLTVFDYGESLSATAMGLFAMMLNPITKQREIHLLKEYHHLNNEVPEHQKKNQLDYVNDYVNFIKESITMMNGKYPEYVLYDGTDQLKRDLQKVLNQNRLGNLSPRFVTKEIEPENPKKNAEKRIYLLQTSLFREKFRMNRACTYSIEDVRNAVLDEKKYESTGDITVKVEFNQSGHMDHLANIDYALAQYLDLIR